MTETGTAPNGWPRMLMIIVSTVIALSVVIVAATGAHFAACARIAENAKAITLIERQTVDDSSRLRRVELLVVRLAERAGVDTGPTW